MIAAKKNYLIEDLTRIPPTDCPCGQARRAFASPDNHTATIHLVDIRIDARTHYHKKPAAWGHGLTLHPHFDSRAAPILHRNMPKQDMWPSSLFCFDATGVSRP